MVKISKVAMLQYALIYLMFISTRACLFFNYSNLFVYIILIACLLVSLKYRRVVSVKLYAVFGALALSLMLTRFLRGGYGLNYWLALIAVIWIAYVAYKVNEQFFMKRFVNLVIFFAVISLVFWCVSFISSDLLEAILISDSKEIFEGTKGVMFYSFHYAAWDKGDFRNSGIFTEPGIYQVVLNSALFILTFYNKERVAISDKRRNWYIAILIVTVLTTQSTTGYFSLLVVLTGYILSQKDTAKGKVIKILFVLGMVLLANYISKGEESIIHATVIEKIVGTSGEFDLAASTGFYRVNGIQACWEIFKEYPLGAGDLYTQRMAIHLGDETNSGAGLFVFLSSAGIISFAILGYIYFYMGKKNVGSVVPYIVYLFMWINTALAQSEIVYACIIMFAFIPRNQMIINNKGCTNGDYTKI